MKNHNNTTRNAGRTLNKDDCDDICNMYEAGIPACEIVEKYGIHRTTLPKIYKRHRGITRSLIPKVNHLRYFQSITSHEKAYFLGFIAADGCIVDNSARGGPDSFAINIHKKDRVILDKLKDVLEMEHGIYEISSKDQVAIRFTNQIFCDDLKQYGLNYRKSLTMPNILPLIPIEYRDSFILGYLDGDGWITIKRIKYKSPKGYEKIYSDPSMGFCGTKEFLQGIAEHLGITNPRISLKKNNSIHALTICARNDFWRVYDRIYKNSNRTVHLERKKNVINQI